MGEDTLVAWTPTRGTEGASRSRLLKMSFPRVVSPLSSRSSGERRQVLKIRFVSFRFSALKSSTASFPGPVFFDPATPRGATGDKSKKAAVLGYLDARAVEIEQGLGWLKGKGNEPKFRSEEGKAVLLRLLAVMVGNEGRLMGR